ncbi:MAG: hypothetical protein AB7W59_28830 [Acidimicrobiia bacterium]
MRSHRSPRRFAAVVSAVALIVSCLRVDGGPAGAQAVTTPHVFAPIAAPSAFFPLTAQRVYEGDTGALDRGGFPFGLLTVPLGPGVPSGATAAVVNVTTVTQFPVQFNVCGTRTQAQPWWCNSGASTAYPDFLEPGQSHAAQLMATVGLGADRTLSIEGLWAPGRVTVDLLGYYAPAGATPAAGRYRPSAPQRALDTRDVGGPLEDGAVTVSLGGLVPADTSAVMATVTVVDADRDSYVTAYPTGTAAPYASNALLLAPNRTLTNQFVVPVTNNGFDVRISGRAHVLVDVVGSFTSSASAPGADGLYVPIVSTPLDVPAQAGVDPFTDPYGNALRPEVPRTVPFATPVFGPAVGALSLVVEAQPLGAGFVTVWAGGARPWTTNLFSQSGNQRTNVAATTGVSGSGFEVVSTELTFVGVTVLGYYAA